MREPLKVFFDRKRVARLADEFARAWPPFPRAAFLADATRGLEDRELLDRGRSVARALARALPADYPEALAIVLRTMGPPLRSSSGNGMEPFHHLPHVVFVAEQGLDHPAESLEAQRELTRRFSCEYSIRPYLERHPALTLETLRRWARDPDEHVRRLVSEGTRPRLPWAPRLPRFQEDPTPVLGLLELLRDDPSAYVRRSVANNVNDIAKDHPDVALATLARWNRNPAPAMGRLVRHAARTMIKQGRPEALALVGAAPNPRVEASLRVSPARVAVGAAIGLEASLRSRSSAEQRLVVDFALDFVKADGGRARKVFKWRTLTLAGRTSADLRKSFPLRHTSGRTVRAGVHGVTLLVNGRAAGSGSFRVVPVRR